MNYLTKHNLKTATHFIATVVNDFSKTASVASCGVVCLSAINYVACETSSRLSSENSSYRSMCEAPLFSLSLLALGASVNLMIYSGLLKESTANALFDLDFHQVRVEE